MTATKRHQSASAPDIPIQHLAGGGSANGTELALDLFAEAIAVGQASTRNLYFDVATNVAAGQPPEVRQKIADALRRIGLERVLFGSDRGGPLHDPGDEWKTFASLPLTAAEFRQVARNVAPYMRERK
jgi:predicted TIM-barrel fold metal-dependent hydrolase